MKLKMFSIYDTKALAFGVPFFMQSIGLATRGFSDLVNDPQSSVNKHPTDYILFEIGEFDDEKAVCQSLVPPKQLGLASDFINEKPTNRDIRILENLNGSKKVEEVLQ